MSDCARRDEVTQAVRAGHWPQGCVVDLQEHVAGCSRCAEEVRLLSAFALAREGAMRTLPFQSAELLWWRAQLRRRHNTMERLQRPALAISAATITASVVLLVSALAVVWKRIEWTRLAVMFSSVGWNGWIMLSVAAVLCGFVVTALVVVSSSLRERG
jgi:hypothetical protein